MLYRWIYDHLLVRTDPEIAHDVAMNAIGVFGRSPLARLSEATVGYRGGGSFSGILSRPVPGRLGLAAGQDKDAQAILGTLALGFGLTGNRHDYSAAAAGKRAASPVARAEGERLSEPHGVQ